MIQELTAITVRNSIYILDSLGHSLRESGLRCVKKRRYLVAIDNAVPDLLRKLGRYCLAVVPDTATVKILEKEQDMKQLIFGEEKPVKVDFRFLFSVSLLVPEGFNHSTCLDDFGARRRQEFYHYRPEFTDAHYAHASVRFKPGQRIKAKFFAVTGKPSTQEAMAFIRERKGFPPGAQGVTFIHEQAKEKLLKEKVYAFLGAEDDLWKTNGNSHVMPVMPVYSDGERSLGLVDMESPLDQDNLILVSFHYVDA